MNDRMMQFLPVVILGAGVLLISGIREQHAMQPRTPMNAIPVAEGAMPVKDVTVAEEERKVAGMSDYMLRQVGHDSAMAYSVYVGYYDRQVQGKSIHSPKNCLPGAGWEIVESRKVPLPGGAIDGRVNRVLLANKGTMAMVYYWYQGRGRVEASEYRVKWDLLRDAAVHGRTEEALVRVVVPLDRGLTTNPASRNAEIARADSVGARVASTLAPAVQQALPAWPGQGS